MDNQFINMMHELQVSLNTDEDLTVIPADTFAKDDSSISTSRTDRVRGLPIEFPPAYETEKKGVITEDDFPLKPRLQASQERPARPDSPPIEMGNTFFCSTADVYDTFMPSYRQPPPALTANNSMVENSSDNANNAAAQNNSAATPNRLLGAPTNVPGGPSPSALKAGARAWRELHGRPASVKSGIDFRTGLSGHMALLSTNVHPHDYLDNHYHHNDSTTYRSSPGASQGGGAFAGSGGTPKNNGSNTKATGSFSWRSMSNHSGLTMWKPVRREARPSHSNLGIPSFGDSPPRTSDGGATASAAGTGTPNNPSTAAAAAAASAAAATPPAASQQRTP